MELPQAAATGTRSTWQVIHPGLKVHMHPSCPADACCTRATFASGCSAGVTPALW